MHLALESGIGGVATQAANPAESKMLDLKTILNFVEKQKGFVYHDARFDKNREAILIDIRPHRRSRPACSSPARPRAELDAIALEITLPARCQQAKHGCPASPDGIRNRGHTLLAHRQQVAVNGGVPRNSA